MLGSIWTTGCQITLDVFDQEVALDLIETHGVTATLGVPTMLAAMAEAQHARPRRTDSLRLIAHGGSPVATEVLRRTHNAFPSAQLVEVYGATELSPLATVLVGEEQLLDSPRARSCGRPMVGNAVRILNIDGQDVARGEVGEVVVPGAERAAVDPAEIIAFCKQQIAGYKVPKGIDIQLAPLPKSGSGKVLKRELRAPYWEGQERGVH